MARNFPRCYFCVPKFSSPYFRHSRPLNPMPLARIITRSTEESQEVAAQLRARGFEVEMALPGNVPARPADLELRVEECAPEEALRRAGALSGSEDLCVYIAPGAIAGLRPIAVIPFLPELLREKAPITDSVTASAQPEASEPELSEVNISEADAKIAPATADVPEVVLTEAVSSEIQSAELVPELSDAVIDRLEIFVPELSEAGAEIASAEADGAEIEAAEVVHEGFTQMADPSVASTQTEVFVSELHESEFSELVLAEAGPGEATAEDGSAEARHALITQSSEIEGTATTEKIAGEIPVASEPMKAAVEELALELHEPELREIRNVAAEPELPREKIDVSAIKVEASPEEAAEKAQPAAERFNPAVLADASATTASSKHHVLRRSEKPKSTPDVFFWKLATGLAALAVLVLLAGGIIYPRTPFSADMVRRSEELQQRVPFALGKAKNSGARSDSSQAAVATRPTVKTVLARSVSRSSAATSISRSAKYSAKKPLRHHSVPPGETRVVNDEVVIRRYGEKTAPPAVPTPKQSGVKRYSDLD